MFLLYLFYFLIIFTGNLMAHKRKLSTVINPGCSDPECDVRNESSALFVHVRAIGDNDTLHHIWDFTYCPSLIIARTALDTYLDVTWDKYLKTNKVSVNFSAPPKYLFGVTIDRLFEFDDESDVGVFNITNNKADYVRVMHTHDFHWKLGQSLVNDTETALLSVEGTRHDSEHNRTGVIRITMGAYGGDDHGSMLPHLLHSSNSSQMDIILENMPTKFARSRFGVSLVTVSSDVSNSTMALNTRRSLDDEHDPGVFTIVELTSPGARSEKECTNEAEGGYLQWRPVVYTSRMRDATYSLDSLQYDIVNVADEERLNNTLFQKLFGEKLFDQLVTTTNVTFGNAGDKYYNKTNFSTWSFVAGVGCPMEEQFSMFVMLVLAIGLGLPILLIVFGVLCVVIRRLLKNKDDLFLSQ